MGATRGWGRLTVALMSEFPAVLAGNGAGLTLGMGAAPVALMVWQLTMASKSGTGLVPCSAGGTGGWAARARPRTGPRRCPPVCSQPGAAGLGHARPPPRPLRLAVGAA